MMTNGQIIEMAKRAGFSMENSAAIQAAERFAQLVRNVALAEPAVEPFGYFRAEPFGRTDCAPTDEGAKALYEVPPPAEPARTSQDVCTVPLLSDAEIIDAGLSIGWVVRYMDKSESEFARAIEQLVRRKAGL